MSYNTGSGGGGSAETDPRTTAGDIDVWGTAPTRLPVGADSSILVADSTQSLKMRWRPAPSVVTTGVNYNNVAANAFSNILSLSSLPANPPVGSMWVWEVSGDIEVSVNTTNVNLRSTITTSGLVVVTTAQILGTVLGTATVRGLVIRGQTTVEDATHFRGTIEVHVDTGVPNVLSADDLTAPNQTTAVAFTASQFQGVGIQIAWSAGPAATNAFNAYTGILEQVA